MFFAIQKIALIRLPIFVYDSPFTIHNIVFESSFIKIIVSQILSNTIFNSIHKMSLISSFLPIYASPYLLAQPIRQIAYPLTLIYHGCLILLRDKLAIAFCLLIIQLALIVPLIDRYEPSLSMRYSINKIPCVIAAIWIY